MFIYYKECVIINIYQLNTNGFQVLKIIQKEDIEKEIKFLTTSELQKRLSFKLKRRNKNAKNN